MSKVKRQHYVPQFYLRNFSNNGDIYVFDKKDMKPFKSDVSKIANERYFYNTNAEDIETVKHEFEQDPAAFLESIKEIILEIGDKRIIEHLNKTLEQPDANEKILEMIMDNQYIETKLLAPSEGNWASLVKNVMNEIKWRKRIKKGQRKDLAFMMAVQWVRTPKFRYETINLQEKVINHIFQEEIKDSGENIRFRFDKDFGDRITTQFLTDLEFITSLANVFLSHIWTIGLNHTSTALYTSDSPVVKTGHIKNRSLGFASLGVEIAYPLSKNYVLLLYEREYFQKQVKEGQVLLLKEEHVEFYNSMQVQQSRRQVYCPENDFYLAIDMCTKNPKLRDPDRSNIRIE